ncbi:MAG: LysR family transcriptional regulator, partial [Lachnospiraceae bacterium]|nr:LysR family transcriptional regulator [Lachnospiraceae bacterium]
ALSRHIKELEDELGVQLFERSAKSVELTWLGSQILGYARKMIALRDECMGMISDAVERMDNTVRISCTRNWSFTDFYKIVETFKKENPNYSMDIMQCTDHEVFKMMENGRAAIAFARELREKQTDGYERIRFSTDEIRVLIPCKDPLSSRESVSILELKNRMFMLHSTNSILHDVEMQVCRDNGFEPSYSLRGMDLYETMSLVRGAECVCLAFGSDYLSENLNNVYVLKPCVPRLYSFTNLVYNKNILTGAEKKFISYYQEWMSGAKR